VHIAVDTPPAAAAAAAAAAALPSGALEDGVSVGGRFYSLGSYESNVLYTLRFMVDTDMGGGQWIEVPAGETLILFVWTKKDSHPAHWVFPKSMPRRQSQQPRRLHALRFMVDTDMGGGQRLEVPAGEGTC
jgi:hypothetical protein